MCVWWLICFFLLNPKLNRVISGMRSSKQVLQNDMSHPLFKIQWNLVKMNIPGSWWGRKKISWEMYMEDQVIHCEQVAMNFFSSVLFLGIGEVGKQYVVGPYSSLLFPCMSFQISTWSFRRIQGYFPDLPLETHTKSIDKLLFNGWETSKSSNFLPLEIKFPTQSLTDGYWFHLWSHLLFLRW